MPSVEVHYKDAGGLRFLKLLSGYFGFKEVEKSATPHESDPSKDESGDHPDHALIPGNDHRKYEAFLTSKGLDASMLRRDLWKRG
jgi:hypothetical protein